MEEGEKAEGLTRAVADFVEKLYEEYRLVDLLSSDLQRAKNAVEVAFDELVADLYSHPVPLKSKGELKKIIHAHVPSDHRFLYDDVIEWNIELDGLFRESISDGEGDTAVRAGGLSQRETSRALEGPSIRKKARGLSHDEVGTALEELLTMEDLTQPKRIWDRLMSCRTLPPHDYRVKTRGILRTWKIMWDNAGRDISEFNRFLYSMLKLSEEDVEVLRRKKEDLNDPDIQRASYLHSALQIFSANLAEDLARMGKLGRPSVTSRTP